MIKNKQILNQILTASCPHEPCVLVENILSEIYIKQSVKTLDISENFNIPKPAAVVIRNELLSNGLIEQVNRKIHLSPRGIEYVRNTLRYGLVCLDKYQQFIHEHSEIVEFIHSKIQSILKQRPYVKYELDQAHCTIETLLNRVRFSLLNFDIIGRRVLCIGDDDCLSIAIISVLKAISIGKGLICDIIVVDIDERLTKFIKLTGINENYPIDTVLGNLQCHSSIKLPQNIDTVFTDPPYTINGLNLFLSVANISLKPSIGGKVYWSFGQKKAMDLMKTQNIIDSNGFLIEQIRKKFNRYEGASILGGRSNMYYLMKIKSKIDTAVEIENIYTYSNRNKQKRDN